MAHYAAYNNTNAANSKKNMEKIKIMIPIETKHNEATKSI